MNVPMEFGNLRFEPINNTPNLVSDSVARAAAALPNLRVAEIDPALSDTAAFCEHYKIRLDQSANCVILEAKRADRVWYAACVILATTRADINGTVRKHLDARKVSFAPIQHAVNATGMEYGGITPVGLPEEFPILIDTRVLGADYVIVGSGLRASKLLVKPSELASLPGAIILDIVTSPT
jgi:prolyl-tRNA editing enzyme YbaK/EbsC (Cys-tRNA(Pro) deacylase)